MDEEAVRDAIKEVRSVNESDTNWMAVTYEGPKSMKLRLLGKGTGGADELAELVKPEMAVYALIRVVDRIDNSDTVKFVFVLFLGEKLFLFFRFLTEFVKHEIRKQFYYRQTYRIEEIGAERRLKFSAYANHDAHKIERISYNAYCLYKRYRPNGRTLGERKPPKHENHQRVKRGFEKKVKQRYTQFDIDIYVNRQGYRHSVDVYRHENAHSH